MFEWKPFLYWNKQTNRKPRVFSCSGLSWKHVCWKLRLFFYFVKIEATRQSCCFSCCSWASVGPTAWPCSSWISTGRRSPREADVSALTSCCLCSSPSLSCSGESDVSKDPSWRLSLLFLPLLASRQPWALLRTAGSKETKEPWIKTIRAALIS